MFFLPCEHLDGAVLVAGRDDHLGEDLGDLLGHLDRHRAVGRDHAAERGDRVARVRLAVRLGDVGADRDAARVGVLDDRDRRLVEVVRRAAGGVGVDVVVVGHLLAVQLLGLRQAGSARSRCGRARPAGAGSRRSAAPPPGPRSRPIQAGKPVPVGGVGEHVAHPGRHGTSYVAVCTNASAASRWRCVEREAAGARRRRARRRTASGEVTIATDGWFLAAARTIDGPPMSICSTHSSGVAPEATVCGERVEVGDHEVERLDAELGELLRRGSRGGGRRGCRRAPSGAASSPGRRGTRGSR